MDTVSQIQQLVAQGYSPEAAAALVSRQSGVNTTSGNDVEAAIQATAKKAGMDPNYWRAIASIESSMKPGSNANNPLTQYKGLYQIGSRGSQSEWATHGSGNIYNPMDNATAAANLAADNNAWFASKYGRAPTPIETYMMHQQGRGFYLNGTMTNIAGNTPKGYPIAKTPQEYEAMWGGILARRAGMDPSELTANSVASSGGGVGGGGGGAAAYGAPSAVASAASGGTAPTAPTTDTDTDSGAGDFASAMKGVADKIAKANEANAPQPLQPLQIAAPMTPAMIRARQLAQAMMSQPLPTGSTQT